MLKKIKSGILLSYLSIALNIASGLFYTPWMISQIGQNQYGIYTLITSLVTLLVFDFGLSSSAAKFISNYHAANDEDGANRALGIIYKLYLIADIIIFVILFVLYFFLEYIYVKLTPDELSQLKIAYIIVALYSLVSFPFVSLNGVLTAYEKFSHIKIAEIIYRCVILFLMIIALSMGMGLYALVIVNAIAGMVTIGYKYLAIKRTTPIRANFRENDYSVLMVMLKFSFWITVHSLAQRLIFNITPSILGVVSSSAEIAIFGVVTTIESYVYVIATALNGMFMPKIARIMAGNDKEKDITPLMIKIGLFQYVINIAMVIGFVCAGRDFILLWMGDSYIKAYWGIILVIIPGIYYNPLQIAHTTMMLEGKAKALALINVSAGLMNIFLSIILASVYGMIGSCFSIMVAYLLRDLMVFIVYPRCIKVNMRLFVEDCLIKPLLPTLMCLALCWSLSKLFVCDTWMELLVKCAMIAVIIGMFTLGYYIFIMKGKPHEERERKN